MCSGCQERVYICLAEARQKFHWTSGLVILAPGNKRFFLIMECFKTLLYHGADGLDLIVFVGINSETRSAGVVLKKDQFSSTDRVRNSASNPFPKKFTKPLVKFGIIALVI